MCHASLVKGAIRFFDKKTEKKKIIDFDFWVQFLELYFLLYFFLCKGAGSCQVILGFFLFPSLVFAQIVPDVMNYWFSIVLNLKTSSCHILVLRFSF